MVNVQLDSPVDIPRSNQTIYDNTFRIALCYIFWTTLYFVIGLISKIFIPEVRALKLKEQMFWGLSMVRAVAGFIVIATGYVVFIDSSLSVDHIFATTNASWFLVSCILGFFIFEELALIYFDLRYQTFSKELHLHHILGFSLYFIAAWYGIAHYYVLKIYVLEASTPFSCLCWCLLKLKMERTKVWKVNQWILIYIFHARTLYELHCWYVCYQDWAYMKANLPLAFIVNMLAALIIVTFWLTPYWTYRKTVQFFFHIDWNMEVKEQCKGKNSKAS